MRETAKTWLLAAVTLAALVFAMTPRASAQGDGTITGQVMDVAGKPWVDIAVQVVSEQGAKQETKTDKDGKYSIRNLRSGVYSVFIVLPAPNQPYEIKTRVQGGQPVTVDANFKDIVAKQGAAAQEQMKKQEEEKTKFEGMKSHFSAGTALLEQEKAAKADLQKAAPDQREAAKQKLLDLSNQASTEFQAAQKAAPERDLNQHLLWAKLGESYDIAGRNDEAAQAYQQAITWAESNPSLKGPQVAGYYNNLGNVLARAGKVDEAERVAEHARRTVGREDVWSRASTLHALGTVRAAQRRTDEAEALLREALAIVEPTMYRNLTDEVRASLTALRTAPAGVRVH